MKTRLLIIASLASLFLFPFNASAETCVPITSQQVAGLFDRWNDSLKTKDPMKVTKNYDVDAVLLPTLSNKPRTNHQEIQQYFEMFLKQEPVGKINQRVIRIGCNWATDTGIYTFTLKNDDGKKTTAQARYSFVYEYVNGKWLIVHHHSSLMPEKETDNSY